MSYNELKINLSNIKDNFSYMKSLGNEDKYYAVVKADGYGLGAIEISRYLEDIADGFCVAIVDEAVDLRKAGIKKDILVLGYHDKRDYEKILKYNITTSVFSYEKAFEMNNFFKKRNKIGKIHIQIDTGHGRLGFQKSENSINQIEKISKLSNIKITGIYSHLSDRANEDKTYTYEQKKIFDYFLKELKNKNIDYGMTHLANDAGVYNFNFEYDMARLGVCIYGEFPDSTMKEKLRKLKRTFTWKGIVTNVKYIDKGQTISYGRSFMAKKRMKIATIGVGYADGYKRSLSDIGYVLINGKKAKICGLVNMDQLMVDADNIDVEIGDEAIFIGKSGNETISCEDFANWANTISYEIMTSISKRVKRVYYEN